ncbi:MAG: hypothetical protein EZS28_015676 [Streblomastix strix]|uniref:Uncharacterized protein n=1 Tax=Streblomastix strix TaxID=222440 RepID=A0A5J4W2P9_9EUKA|nr:MAG: hypothetical protein EZS28_015676 [Streblomastix strix]
MSIVMRISQMSTLLLWFLAAHQRAPVPSYGQIPQFQRVVSYAEVLRDTTAAFGPIKLYQKRIRVILNILNLNSKDNQNE